MGNGQRQHSHLTKEHGDKVKKEVGDKVRAQTSMRESFRVAHAETLRTLKEAVAAGATGQDIVQQFESMSPDELFNDLTTNTEYHGKL